MTANSSELWVIAAIAAAAFQTLRFMLQKSLSVETLTPAGATFARFLYSAPVIFVIVVLYFAVSNRHFPDIHAPFWFFTVAGGLAQIIATVCVVTLFKSRNFAVGLTLIKTEVIMSVLVGIVLLGDAVSLSSFAAILLGIVGVLLLSPPPDVHGWGWREMMHRSVLLGLSAGFLFGISAVSYRGASLEIDTDAPVLRAAITLSAVTMLQMLGMLLWFFLRDRAQVTAVWRARRNAIWIGLLSLAGSFCWFLAFTLQNAAYVKAVGQIELAFAAIASVVFFKERISFMEFSGMAVLCGSILMLIMLTHG